MHGRTLLKSVRTVKLRRKYIFHIYFAAVENDCISTTMSGAPRQPLSSIPENMNDRFADRFLPVVYLFFP